MPAIHPAFIYLGASALIPLIKGRARQIYVMAVALFTLIDVLMLKHQSSWVTSFMGFKVTLLHVDRISYFVAAIFAVISVIAILYALRVDDVWHHLNVFWYIGSAFGAVFAGDLLSFYLFWELMVVGSTGLVLLNKKDPAAIGAGFRYLLMHLIGGAILIGGIFMHYMNAHSLAIGPLDYGWGSYLILFGVGMNAGWLLIHTWIPDAYPRALYTGSVFMCVFTTKTAVYALVRFAPGWDFVAYMGAGMAIFGAMMALVQGNARKLLSYSIFSQVGYMVAAIGLGGALGVDGALLHLLNHIMYKALLFMAIGAVIYRTGKEDLVDLGGVWRKMPITTACAVIASFTTSGLPLLSGYVSKSLIFEATEGNATIELILELAAVTTFLVFLKFVYFGFFRPNKENEIKATEVPVNMIIAMLCSATVCVAVGLFPQVFIHLLPFSLPASESSIYIFSKLIGVTQILGVTGIFFFFLLPVFSPRRVITYDVDWFYARIGEGLQVVAEGFSRANNAFERATGTLVPAIMSLKPGIYKINELGSRLLFALTVDMWLFKPVTPPAEEKLGQAAKGGVVDDISRLGEKGSRQVGKIDIHIIDAFLNVLAEFGERISYFVGRFDNNVVDGVVNWIGRITLKAGKKLRPTQTGDVQTYGLIMMIGALFALIFLVLVFYGVISLV